MFHTVTKIWSLWCKARKQSNDLAFLSKGTVLRTKSTGYYSIWILCDSPYWKRTYNFNRNKQTNFKITPAALRYCSSRNANYKNPSILLNIKNYYGTAFTLSPQETLQRTMNTFADNAFFHHWYVFIILNFYYQVARICDRHFRERWVRVEPCHSTYNRTVICTQYTH